MCCPSSPIKTDCALPLGLSAQTNLVALHVAMVGHANGSTQNNPPLAPTLSGPSSGQRGVLYNFTVVTTDPDDDDVYYCVDWGDGTNSGWVGPFPSGMHGNVESHLVSSRAPIPSKRKQRTPMVSESSWTPFDMIIAGPGLDIEISRWTGDHRND